MRVLFLKFIISLIEGAMGEYIDPHSLNLPLSLSSSLPFSQPFSQSFSLPSSLASDSFAACKKQL
jgi:hypothetical protein